MRRTLLNTPVRCGAMAMTIALAGCSGISREAALLDTQPTGAGVSDPYVIVDCMLPPQLIRQGMGAVHFGPSRPAKISRRLCAQQGGAQTLGLTAWQALADSGHAEAQNYLGEMYEYGTGGAPKDLQKARSYYEKASAAGNGRAAASLSRLLASGAPGVPQSPARAVELAAAAAGVPTKTLQLVDVNQGRPVAATAATAGSGAIHLKQFPFGRYRALLIGNSNYVHAPKLDSPVNEVDVIGALLEKKYGFKVTKLKNATRDQILRKLDDLHEELRETDNLLVYYTGHGAESASREGFWIPVDGESPTSTGATRTRLWVSSAEVRELLSVMAPLHILVVADSCYSARFLQFKGIPSISPGVSLQVFMSTFGEMYAKKSRTALTSGGLAPVVDANDGSRMSPFAKAFVAYLERNNAPVSSVDVFAGIQMDVIDQTSRMGFAQQPQWGPVTGAGHVSGDFWFRPN